MSQPKKVKRCAHCGIILQDKISNEEGYISPSILKKYPDGILVCDSCFSEEKKKENKDFSLSSDYTKILEQIKKENAIVVYVVDLFSFEGSFPTKIIDYLNNLNIIFVGNKRDLLPKEIKDENLLKYIKYQLKKNSINPYDCYLLSTNISHETEELFMRINNISKGKNVYFIGPSNSGKSTIINNYLKNIDNKTNKMIVYNTFEGTKLRGFKIPISEKCSIYEVPGFVANNNIQNLLEKPIINSVIPTKAVKKVTKTLTKNSGLFISGLGLITLISQESTKIDCYFSEKIKLRLKSYSPEKSFWSFIEKNGQEYTSYKYKDINDFDIYELDISEKGERDIGILGLGWITFKGNNQKFRIYVPKGVYIFNTRSKVC